MADTCCAAPRAMSHACEPEMPPGACACFTTSVTKSSAPGAYFLNPSKMLAAVIPDPLPVAGFAEAPPVAGFAPLSPFADADDVDVVFWLGAVGLMAPR